MDCGSEPFSGALPAAFSAPVVIAFGSASSGPQILNINQAVPGGALLYLFNIIVAASPGDAVNVNDLYNGSWTALNGSSVNGTPGVTQSPFCVAAVQTMPANAAINVDLTGNVTTSTTVILMVASGGFTLDTNNEAATTGTGNSPTITNASVLQTSELVFGALGTVGSTTYTESAGFINVVNAPASTGSIGIGYRLNPSPIGTGQLNYHPTLTGAPLWAAALDGFIA